MIRNTALNIGLALLLAAGSVMAQDDAVNEGQDRDVASPKGAKSDDDKGAKDQQDTGPVTDSDGSGDGASDVSGNGTSDTEKPEASSDVSGNGTSDTEKPEASSDVSASAEATARSSKSLNDGEHRDEAQGAKSDNDKGAEDQQDTGPVTDSDPSGNGTSDTEKPEASDDVSASAEATARSSSSSIGLGLDVPEIASLPGGVSPAFGQYPGTSSAWRFDFHGMVYLPLRFGIGERELPGANQKRTVLHAPPRVPGSYETFGYTSVVPNPWTQLNFTYGNDKVSANVVVAARTVSNANGYFNPPDMLGINDAYITFKGNPKEGVRLELNMGGFANRYGAMGEYDLGRYGTPLIARVGGTGLTGNGQMDIGDFTIISEVGFQGQLGKAPVGVEPAGWNGFADPNVGSSFAVHGHVGMNYKRLLTLGGHYIHAFTRDDRAANDEIPDGSISVGAADVRLTLGRIGHLYLAYSHTEAKTARAVSNVIRILNAPGGPGLMREYLGENSGGTGSLDTIGGQYDFSLGNLLRYPDAFEGNGPDLTFSAFGLYTHVTSPNDAAHDSVGKLKMGGELGYSALKWLAFGARYDHVMEHLKVNTRSHSILTGRIILHSDWNSQDQLALQYSYFNCGSETAVREGYPPVDNPTIVPDEHVISITASMWW